MVLVQDDNSILADGTEQNLFISQLGLKHFSTWLFTHNMLSGDVLVVREYTNDKNSGVERSYNEITITDSQISPGIFFPFVPTDSYRVTIQQTAGTFRTYTWSRQEV